MSGAASCSNPVQHFNLTVPKGAVSVFNGRSASLIGLGRETDAATLSYFAWNYQVCAAAGGNTSAEQKEAEEENSRGLAAAAEAAAAAAASGSSSSSSSST